MVRLFFFVWACHAMLASAAIAVEPEENQTDAEQDGARIVAAKIRKQLSITPIRLDDLLRRRLTELEHDRKRSVEVLEIGRARLKAARTELIERERAIDAGKPAFNDESIETSKRKLGENRETVADWVSIGMGLEQSIAKTAVEILMLRAVFDGNQAAVAAARKPLTGAIKEEKARGTATERGTKDQPLTIDELYQRLAAIRNESAPVIAHLMAFHHGFKDERLPVTTKYGDQRLLNSIRERAELNVGDFNTAISTIINTTRSESRRQATRLQEGPSTMHGLLMNIENEAKAIADEKVKSEDGSLKRAQEEISSSFKRVEAELVDARSQIPRAQSHLVECCILTRLIDGSVEPGARHPKRRAITGNSRGESSPARIRIEPLDPQLLTKAADLLERWPKIVAQYESLRAQSNLPSPRQAN
jgi:hypothetical protein